MKKKKDLSALAVDNNTKQLDIREKVVRKSAAVTVNDLTIMQSIKDKCLNHKIVLNDSEVIRLGLLLASQLSENELVEASKQVKKIPAGRPKGT